MNQRARSLIFWALCCGIALLSIAFYGLQVAASPPAVVAQYVPDDGYYYLTIGRNFSELGIWTFDRGRTVTSGYHPLFAYLLAGLHAITQPSPDGYVSLGVLLTLMASLIAAAIAIAIVWKRRSAPLLLVLAVILSTRNVAQNAASVMEWGFVVVAALVYVVLFYRVLHQGTVRPVGVALFVCALVGSLARSDFGLLPVSCFAAAVLVAAVKTRRLRLFPYAWGVAGAVCGVALVLLNNYAFTNEFLQASVKIKAFWSTVYTWPLNGHISILGRILGFEANAVEILMSLTLVLAMYLLVKRLLARRRRRALPTYPVERSDLTLWLASVMTLTGYILLSMRNGDLQAWYTSNLIVPMFVVTSGVIVFASSLFRRRLMPVVTLVAVLIIIFNITSLYPVDRTRAPYPVQGLLYAASQYLRANPPDGLVGAWNAGVISYYSQVPVMNLDGLMNDSVYPYVVSNTLPTFIAQQDIRVIVDTEGMITDEIARNRGGYNDPAFVGLLRPIESFHPTEPAAGRDNEPPVWVYEIRR